MFKLVTPDDFVRVEGEVHPQIVIDGELERLGGGGWDGFSFKVRVLKAMGYDVDHPPEFPVRMQAYNQIAESLNRLGTNVSAKTLCKDLSIEETHG